MAKLIFFVSELGVAKLKCHRPIMVNVVVYAMRFATRPELPRELSFMVGVGGPKRESGQKFGDVNLSCFRVRGWQS